MVMKIFLMIMAGAVVIWPIICWFSYHMVGWRMWELKFFRAQTTLNTSLASSVSLKKFGSYNLLVFVGVEEYGVAFVPSWLLIFHKRFSIPWANIMSFSLIASHASTKCLLNTNVGQIVITGDIAEIVARGCESHYVSKR